jgi:serine/threonine protein kinase
MAFEATFRQGAGNRIFLSVAARDLIERVRKALGDRYNVITAVGRGGTASIFGAYDTAGRKVAIKVLHPELTVSVAADRFLREIRYASQLHHPHVAPLLDSGETEYLLWYVMPYVPGETLRQALRRDRMLAVDRAAGIGCEVLEALTHAHEHGLAHRDIKPDNIVLSPEGAVLVDFGISRAIAQSGEDRVTRSGFVVGTEEYMSPEQAAGAPDIDGRTDLYSLGVVLFEALAGRPPFSSPSAAAVLDMQQHHAPPELRPLRPDVPAPLAAAITKALAKSRAERWQTAREMREALLPPTRST